ncbi:dicarboxylate/amino acid:cation symporter [Mycoplasma capricolum subsp. capripneumoniae]|nr:dicarboxylate/amino acid:cation symporter [Mycoplasma capricolum]QIN44763.1 dicarboxylate/amino acid:cation symporter [Mycoplasma capricolum subsp. capripneumoniae]
MQQEKTNVLLDKFLAIGSWQAAIAVIVFIGIQIGLWFTFKKFKFKFIYRVLIGLAIGLVFGIIIQAVYKFPQNGLVNEKLPTTITKDGVQQTQTNPNFKLWVYQLDIWISLAKNIFINGILLLTAPVVFIAIFRVTSKKGNKNVGRISLKGVGLLLLNTAFAFVITFWLGYLIKVGSGSGLSLDHSIVKNVPKETQPLPKIVWEYLPNNFIQPWLGSMVIPLMVIAGLIGNSVKILSKKKPVEMDAIRKGMDVAWNIVISVLMTFMKIMPLAVMSMIASSVISKPIGALATIGKVLGLGYLGLTISLIFLTLLLFINKINVIAWWKLSFKILIQGFATQSSNATLPMSIETLKDEVKIDDSAVSTIAPLSTTMGLMGCAGVQSGVITSLLWTGATNASFHSMGLFTFFILAFFITLIASLGISGIPGTATVLTSGVLSGLGLSVWFAPVYVIVGSLDGLFDMGRTGVNVTSGVVVTTIVAKTEGLIAEDSTILSKQQLERQKIIKEKNQKRKYKKLKKLKLNKI